MFLHCREWGGVWANLTDKQNIKENARCPFNRLPRGQTRENDFPSERERKKSLPERVLSESDAIKTDFLAPRSCLAGGRKE
jgi:hypothetical protein